MQWFKPTSGENEEESPGSDGAIRGRASEKPYSNIGNRHIIKFADGELSQRIFERSNKICQQMDLLHGVPYERFSYLYNIGFVLSYVEQVIMAQLEAFND